KRWSPVKNPNCWLRGLPAKKHVQSRQKQTQGWKEFRCRPPSAVPVWPAGLPDGPLQRSSTLTPTAAAGRQRYRSPLPELQTALRPGLPLRPTGLPHIGCVAEHATACPEARERLIPPHGAGFSRLCPGLEDATLPDRPKSSARHPSTSVRPAVRPPASPSN